MGKMTELYQVISRNLTPSAQLFTLVDTPTSRNLHSLNIARAAILGVVLLLLAIPLVIGLCVVHYHGVQASATSLADEPS